MKPRLIVTLIAACLAAAGPTFLAGCSSGTSPAFSEEEQKERYKKEVSGEMKALIEMEAKFGADHSQVRQMKMELGLDPDKPASEQSL